MNVIDETFWLKIERSLKSFIYKRVKDKVLTDDLAQEVFLKAHSRIDQLKEGEKLTAWIFRIARHAIVDHYRQQSKSIRKNDLEWDNETASPNFNDCVALCLKEFLRKIPARYREALELTEFGNLSQLQLSERLQLSYSGAKSRVQRARQMLREEMEKRYLIKTDPYGNVIVCENPQPCVWTIDKIEGGEYFSALFINNSRSGGRRNSCHHNTRDHCAFP